MLKSHDAPPRAWAAMLASLHTCFGCGRLLRNSAATSDTFCRDCQDRSRPNDGDDVLGGES